MKVPALREQTWLQQKLQLESFSLSLGSRLIIQRKLVFTPFFDWSPWMVLPPAARAASAGQSHAQRSPRHYGKHGTWARGRILEVLPSKPHGLKHRLAAALPPKMRHLQRSFWRAVFKQRPFHSYPMTTNVFLIWISWWVQHGSVGNASGLYQRGMTGVNTAHKTAPISTRNSDFFYWWGLEDKRKCGL